MIQVTFHLVYFQAEIPYRNIPNLAASPNIFLLHDAMTSYSKKEKKEKQSMAGVREAHKMLFGRLIKSIELRIKSIPAG